MDNLGAHAVQVEEHAGLSGAPRVDVVAPPASVEPPAITVYGYLPYWEDDVSGEQLAGLTHLAIFSVGSRIGDGLVYSWRGLLVKPL